MMKMMMIMMMMQVHCVYRAGVKCACVCVYIAGVAG